MLVLFRKSCSPAAAARLLSALRLAQGSPSHRECTALRQLSLHWPHTREAAHVQPSRGRGLAVCQDPEYVLALAAPQGSLNLLRRGRHSKTRWLIALLLRLEQKV
eukprot:17773-Heterococcus_DN1.PRE.1